jgi:hypothetical protein
MPEGTKIFLDEVELTGTQAQIAEKILSGLQPSAEKSDTTGTHGVNSEQPDGAVSSEVTDMDADGVVDAQSQLPEQPGTPEGYQNGTLKFNQSTGKWECYVDSGSASEPAYYDPVSNSWYLG